MTNRTAATSRVRRCLFPPRDSEEQALTDNGTNSLREIIENNNSEKMRKWGYDFKNDRPLNNRYDWAPGDDRYDWIGRPKPESEQQHSEDENVEEIDSHSSENEESFIPMQDKNEVTPKSNKNDGVDALHVVKKRGKEHVDTAEKGVKRKIDFVE